jgi:DNA-binding beta-propeller fold protein YncE
VKASGNVFVADSTNGRVEVFSPTGKYLFQFGSTKLGMVNPVGIAFAENGDAYVSAIGPEMAGVQRWGY